MSLTFPSCPSLFWPKRSADDSLYQIARREIAARDGQMPEILVGDLEIDQFFNENPDSVLYYPVFYGSTGWWGELLGGDAIIIDRIAISADCQLMKIKKQDSVNSAVGIVRSKKQTNSLFAAEIKPSSNFFKKINSGVVTVLDMLATDSGTVLALFSGKSQSKFAGMVESTGNSYLGCIGGY